jgi:uncharacterized lipoprotein YmbA
MTPRARRAGFALLALSIACGCSSILSPRPDRTKFYVLAPIAEAPAVPSPRLAIGLGPVNFPDYLDHQEVVTRVSSNRIELSATDRWAAPLEESFRRLLAQNLATRIGTERIVSYPWSEPIALNYRIEVTVERFERDSTGGTELAANWLIRDGASDRVLAARQSDFRDSAAIGGTSMDSAAAALSSELGQLSRQIAAAINDVNSSRHASRTD